MHLLKIGTKFVMRSQNHVYYSYFFQNWTLSLNCGKRDHWNFFVCCKLIEQLNRNKPTYHASLENWHKICYAVLKYALNVFIFNQLRPLWIFSNEKKFLRFQKKKVHVCMTGEHFGSKKKKISIFFDFRTEKTLWNFCSLVIMKSCIFVLRNDALFLIKLQRSFCFALQSKQIMYHNKISLKDLRLASSHRW